MGPGRNPRVGDLKKLETEAVDFREAVTRGKRGVKGKEKAGGRSRGWKAREARAEEGSDLFPARHGS